MIFIDTYGQQQKKIGAIRDEANADKPFVPLGQVADETYESKNFIKEPLNQGNKAELYPGTEEDDDFGIGLQYGVASGYYETKSSLQYALSEIDALDEDYQETLKNWAKDNQQESFRFAPDPSTTGTVAQIVYGVSKELTRTAGAAVVAAPVVAVNPTAGLLTFSTLYGSSYGISETQRLLSEGVDEDTAKRAGAVAGAHGFFGSLIPASIGTSRIMSAVYGAGVNLVTNVNEQSAIKSILERADYSGVAENYDPSNPVDNIVSSIVGAAFGYGGASVRLQSANKAIPSNVIEDAARVRSVETENAVNLPVDLSSSEQVARGYETQQAVKNQIDNHEVVSVSDDSVSLERLEELRAISEARLKNAVKETGNVLQNRDRSSKSSIAQMKSIAANPDYGRLGYSRTLSDGAPVVAYANEIPEVQMGIEDFMVDSEGKRYLVRYAVVEADTVSTSHRIDGTENPLYGNKEFTTAIAGNGRITGLREAYRMGTADGYLSELKQDQLPGISPDVFDGMEKPVLVRIMNDSDVTADIGDLSNRSSSAQLSFVEQATTDSQRIDLASLRYTEDGDITPESVAEFTALLPPEERASLIDSQGMPTKPAYDRLRRAIFQGVFGNANATSLLDTTEKTGINRMLRSYLQLAPRLLGLEGELDFRSSMVEVLSELREAKRNGKSVSISDLASQRSFTRSPEADALLQFFAKNEKDGGGVPEIVETLSELAEWAKINSDNASRGADLFGEVVKPTRLDLMRKFSELTGVEIDESKFRSVSTLDDAVKYESRPNIKDNELLESATIATNKTIVSPAPEFERISVAKTNDGKEHFVLGVNGNPDLTVIPEGIDGVQSLPVRLQEETLNGEHIRKHEIELQKAGYESVEQAIWDITQNYSQIYKGSQEGGLVLVRPLTINEDGKLKRGILQVGLQEEAGIYRVGSVFVSANPEFLKNRQLLWGTTQPIRLQSDDLTPTMRTQEFTGPEQSSFIDSIGQEVADVNSLRSIKNAAEKAEDLTQEKTIKENLEKLSLSDNDTLQIEVRQALSDDPNMRIQLDESDTSISAAEFLANEEARAEQMLQEANQGIPVAVSCVLLNDGVK